MNNVVTAPAPSFLIGSSSFLQATSKPIISRIGSKFNRIQPGAYELPALERLEKSLWTYNGRNIATSLVLSILNGSSSFLHTIRTTIKAWMSLNFVKIPSRTFILELARLSILKIYDNVVTTLAPSFDWIFFILAGNKDNH